MIETARMTAQLLYHFHRLAGGKYRDWTPARETPQTPNRQNHRNHHQNRPHHLNYWNPV